MRNFKVLESFRFIGAILVALGHFFWGNGKADKFSISFILVVDFFFVLSAFLITQKQKDFDKKTDSYLKKLFTGRVIRLLFPYMILLFIYYIFFFKFFYNKNINLYEFFISMFLLQIIGLDLGSPFNEVNVAGVSWALGLELYVGTIFFPMIFYLKKKYQDSLVFICIIIFIISLGLLKQFSPDFLNVHYWRYSQVPFGILRILISYSVGSLCAILYQKLKKIKFTKYKIIIFNILEISSLIILIKFYVNLHYNRQNDYVFPIIIGLIITIFAFEIGTISKVLKNFSSLGKLGYSIYLVHPICIQIFRYKEIENTYFYLGSVILFSFIFYYFIEKRIINLKYYLLNKLNS